MQSSLIHPKSATNQQINDTFNPGPQLTAQQTLGIYQRGYILRLTKCLEEQFPALKTALGENLFLQFAKRYLQFYPSESYTLYDLGNRFADFLEQDRPDRNNAQKETWIDFMVDLARYENLHFSLFDAPGNEGKPWPDVAAKDEDLILQPCFALAQYRFPVGWYYHACKDDTNVALPPMQRSWVALLRTNFVVTTFPISQFHYDFLTRLKDTQSVPLALKQVSAAANIDIQLVTQSWQHEVKKQWIKAGFFILRE